MDKNDKDIANKTSAITTNSIAEKVKEIVVDTLALVHSDDAESSIKPKKDIVPPLPHFPLPGTVTQTPKRVTLTFMEALGLGKPDLFYAGRVYTPEHVVKIVSAILTEMKLCPDDSEADIANKVFILVGIKDRYLDSNFQVWRSKKVP